MHKAFEEVGVGARRTGSSEPSSSQVAKFDTPLVVRVLIACHNRKRLTLRAVESVLELGRSYGMGVNVVVFDDGSTDGTGPALARRFPALVTVLDGDGSSYWAAGMAAAESVAISSPSSSATDVLLWLNDDVELELSAVAEMLEALAAEAEPSIYVGICDDPDSHEWTYGGYSRRNWRPLNYKPVPPSGTYRHVDTFNGNVVAMKQSTALLVGSIDGKFSHGYADFEYGIRCKKLGVKILQTPQAVGSCRRNESREAEPILEQWRQYIGVKGGGNPSSLRRVLIKTAPPGTWPLFMAASYFSWWVRILLHARVRRAEEQG